MPGWILVLRAAETWHTPPWQVESEASQLWWERWRVWEDELADHRKRQADKAAGGE